MEINIDTIRSLFTGMQSISFRKTTNDSPIEIKFNGAPSFEEIEEKEYWRKLKLILEIDSIYLNINPEDDKKEEFYLSISQKDDVFFISYRSYFSSGTIYKKLAIFMNEFQDLLKLKERAKNFIEETTQYLIEKINLLNYMREVRKKVINCLNNKFKLSPWDDLYRRKNYDEVIKQTHFYDIRQIDLSTVLCKDEDQKDFIELSIEFKVKMSEDSTTYYNLGFSGALLFSLKNKTISFKNIELCSLNNLWNRRQGLGEMELKIIFQNNTLKQIRKINKYLNKKYFRIDFNHY